MVNVAWLLGLVNMIGMADEEARLALGERLAGDIFGSCLLLPCKFLTGLDLR